MTASGSDTADVTAGTTDDTTDDTTGDYMGDCDDGIECTDDRLRVSDPHHCADAHQVEVSFRR